MVLHGTRGGHEVFDKAKVSVRSLSYVMTAGVKGCEEGVCGTGLETKDKGDIIFFATLSANRQKDLCLPDVLCLAYS